MDPLSLLLVATAIVFEVSGTLLMKYTEGFTKAVPSLVMFVCYAVSIVSLSVAVRKLDIGVIYAIWAGCGVALVTLLGMALFGEPLTLTKVLFILLILVGVVGLNLTGSV